MIQCFSDRSWRRRAGIWLAFGALLAPAVCAQQALPPAPEPNRSVRQHALSSRFPAKPSLTPVFSIPVEPLGFSAPGPLYLGQRVSVASLDFLDEDRLLFTFRVPGLLRREPGAEDERQIRAVVLRIATGGAEAQTLWTLHDRSRYLWMLAGGRFLLRDRNMLQMGDASLALRPYLVFPGPLLAVGIDPTQQLLVTSSREPAAAPSSSRSSSPSNAGSSESADAAGADPYSSGVPDDVLRILDRSTGELKVVTRVRQLISLAINSTGYLEDLPGNDAEWVLYLSEYSGGGKILSRIRSECAPDEKFISETEVLATACADGGDRLLAFTTDGRALWDDLAPSTEVWPLLVMAPNGLRMARETLAAPRAVTALTPLDTSDIKGQAVRVFDAATGEVVLETPASPILDAGGNVAISPSGRRVAVLNAGSIQVFALPEAPPLPSSAALRTGP